MSFQSPIWLALLLAVPIVFWLARSANQAIMDRLSAWIRPALWSQMGFRPSTFPARAFWLAAVLAMSCLALARPRWGQAEQMIESQGVDVVFVIDSSLSMAAEDLAPNRLEVAKAVIRRLIGELPGDRVGLVQAEGEGFVLAPLTFDSAVIDVLLDTVEVATLPRPGTRLSEALSVALDLFDEQSAGAAVLVLLSDGEDHGRNLAPFARKIADQGVIVLAGGVGSPEGVPIPIDLAGQRDFKKDNQGQVVVSKLHEESLEVLARETGGSYRRFDDATSSVQVFVDTIAALEQRQRNQRLKQQREERFQWPLAIALGCLVALIYQGPQGGGKR